MDSLIEEPKTLNFMYCSQIFVKIWLNESPLSRQSGPKSSRIRFGIALSDNQIQENIWV